MDRSIEALKQIDLADFLSRHYGLEFRRRGTAFACRSPFGKDSNPSFFVRPVDGRWLFKDFSSGAGGSIFDFVRMKEKLGSFAETLTFIKGLLPDSAFAHDRASLGDESPSASGSLSMARYDVQALYERFLSQDPDVCRRYLRRRGIKPALVEDLIRGGTVVHNRYGRRSYCCFAVRDQAGRLRCLDNHAVEGSGKFVLGHKSPFSLEWQELSRARTVFLVEGIMDYLSVKTLDRTPTAGLALLGNQLCFDRSLFQRAEILMSALDDDRGGASALRDLRERYRDKPIRIYDLRGRKDPNELLMARRSRESHSMQPGMQNGNGALPVIGFSDPSNVVAHGRGR